MFLVGSCCGPDLYPESLAPSSWLAPMKPRCHEAVSLSVTVLPVTTDGNIDVTTGQGPATMSHALERCALDQVRMGMLPSRMG